MDLQDSLKSFQVLWQQKPGAVVLLVVGFLIFIFLAVDAWRYKRRRKRPKGRF